MSSSSPGDLQATPSRYVVGFDLGTTNSAVTYVDTSESPWQVRTFAVPQLVAPGQIEARETLPSFHYQPATGEFRPEDLKLPWQQEPAGHFVGFFARDHGVVSPGRLIASAKSWLCHGGVDRLTPLLPWHGAADVERISPVEASARYLRHVREAWDAQFPEPLAQQDLVLTLPASFDEVARELTVKAAALAGLNRVVLIEEPQAAFYAWILRHKDDWDQRVTPGQKILVCDVGGGTSDFTLIRVRRTPDDRVQFHRVAVGEHLILGGDNLDLALASHLEKKLTGENGKLEPRQWSVLVRSCRAVKELLLSDNAPESATANVPGSGSRLIGGSLQVEATREEVHELLLEGFLPRVKLDEKPATRRSGFQEFGLPYAADPAITRYLAAFLTAHRHVANEIGGDANDDGRRDDGSDPARPDIILFNGGLFASPQIRQRLLETLSAWFSPATGPAWFPEVLDYDRLDLAVARGAAYYGMVRRGEGVRIAAGLARSYYIGVAADGEAQAASAEQSAPQEPTADVQLATLDETAPSPQPLEQPQLKALCLVPAGVEPGEDVDLTQHRFSLLVSSPVEFPLFVSSTRLTDPPGSLVDVDPEQIKALPPIRTVLRTRKKGEAARVDVQLHARLTEIGTLDLWCSELDGPRSWRLQFDVRSATQTDIAAHESAAEAEGFIDEATWGAARQQILDAFPPPGKAGPGSKQQGDPAGLVKRLAATLGMDRRSWPTSLLRRIWETLMEVAKGRRRSQVHEARWLNLLGFALRPGYGLAVDDWRVAETWRVLQGKLIHATPTCRAEWWILWRRISGGLAAGQQLALAQPLLGPIRAMHKQLQTGKGRGGDLALGSHEAAEWWRLLGALELLPLATKQEIGQMILDLLPKKKIQPIRVALVWALGRIGSRVPMYGPLNAVVPPDVAANWLNKLMDQSTGDPTECLAVMQLARRTDDRYRDLPETARKKAARWLESNEARGHFIALVLDGGSLDTEEAGLVFGEALPQGLRLQA